MDTKKYVASAKLVSDQVTKDELQVILRELSRTVNSSVKGDVVEFGCYVGTTSLHIQRFLKNSPSARGYWVYDSFAGLPEKRVEDQSPAGEQFKAGELYATKAQFIKNFKQAGLPLPRIIKAWFADLQPDNIPKQISFAFLDGDYYDSILDPLKLIWPHLSSGAVVIVDDFINEALPGAKRAVEDWMRDHEGTVHSEASLAIIRLP